jgi:hypothetical protein
VRRDCQNGDDVASAMKIGQHSRHHIDARVGVRQLDVDVQAAEHVTPADHLQIVHDGVVAQSTVSIYMVPRRGRPLQIWKTFIHNHAEGIASIDLFVVPTIAFRMVGAPDHGGVSMGYGTDPMAFSVSTTDCRDLLQTSYASR